MVYKGGGGGGREDGRNKIYAIRQIYALLGFLDAHGFTQRLYVVLPSCGGIGGGYR